MWSMVSPIRKDHRLPLERMLNAMTNWMIMFSERSLKTSAIGLDKSVLMESTKQMSDSREK